jgi:RHS repeat-associated protein
MRRAAARRRYRLQTNYIFRPGVGHVSRLDPHSESFDLTLARYHYEYDSAGNILGIRDSLDSTYDRTFQYDDLHRLTVANTGTSLWGRGSFAWDAMGNIQSLKLGDIEPGPTDPLDAAHRRRAVLRAQEGEPGGPPFGDNKPLGRTSTFRYSGTTPRLAAVSTNELEHSVNYDPAGNETSYLISRTYSPRNLLAEVIDPGEPGDPLQHKITYTYDGRGIRVARTESPSDGPNTSARRFSIYTPELQLMAVTRDDATNVWALSAADKDVQYEIVWFAGRPIAQVTPAGPTLYTYADHLGTPFLQMDATRIIVWQAEYEPFGNVYEMRVGSRKDQPLRFPGQEVAMNWEGQEENYNIFRWYRSGWGRYTQADPIGLAGGSNLFSYENNPIGLKDPSGLVSLSFKFAKKGSKVGGGGDFKLTYGSAEATGKCICANGNYYIRLSVEVELGFICSGKTSCAIEAWHANIASAFVAKAAQEWAQYEKEPYDELYLCKAMAEFYSTSLENDVLKESMWPADLLKSFYAAENDYEETHHGFWCGFMSAPCAW